MIAFTPFSWLPFFKRGAGAPKGYKGATEGEITRGCCLLRGADEHGAKKRSFAFALVYIKCFRTYSVYLSLRLPAQILYAGIHLPPQREARALPRRAPKLTASERKIVTKETHQGCLSFLFKSPLPCKGEARALPRRAQIHRGANLTQQSPEIPFKAALCERKNKKV